MTQLKLGRLELRTLVAAVFYVTDRYVHADIDEKFKAAKEKADWFITEMKNDGSTTNSGS